MIIAPNEAVCLLVQFSIGLSLAAFFSKHSSSLPPWVDTAILRLTRKLMGFYIKEDSLVSLQTLDYVFDLTVYDSLHTHDTSVSVSSDKHFKFSIATSCILDALDVSKL